MQHLKESILLYNIGPISAMTEVHPRLGESSTAILSFTAILCFSVRQKVMRDLF